MAMQIINIKECANLLSVSTRTIQRWIKDERLPYFQVCKKGKILFEKEKVIKWLKNREHPYIGLVKRRHVG